MSASPPVWLEEQTVLAIHERSILRHGGASGIRDKGLLESALARPQQLFAYGEPSVFAMATAYAAGVIKNHPFVDGNKRTGFTIAATFLGVNGYECNADEAEVVVMTLALAAGELREEHFTQWLSDHCTKQ